jgi:hypothetical protein
MSEHAVHAFSAAPRWIPCPGSMAYPENTRDSGDGGFYANEGTAAHAVAARLLLEKNPRLPDALVAGKHTIELTDEFLTPVQTYVDDVKRRALGGYLHVEQKVSLEGVEGFTDANYGTSDVIIAMPARGKAKAYGVVEDLKFGQGERVYAYTVAQPGAPFVFQIYNEADEPINVEPNYQLMLYALAALRDIEMLVGEPEYILLVINQPRVSILSELRVPIAVLKRFAVFAFERYELSLTAMKHGSEARNFTKLYLNAGEKQCRWCQRGVCETRDLKVQEETASDFEVIEEKPPFAPTDPIRLAKAMRALPFIHDWAKAVMAKANEMVGAGIEVIGPDNKPYKFVEGDLGDRKWKDVAAAEAALMGLLDGDKIYKPKQLITAPAAEKLFKKQPEVWKDIFKPMIGRAPGKPKLVMGSDPRPPFSGAAESDEFDTEDSE